MSDIGDFIKAKRNEHGFSQKRLAELTGTCDSQLSKIESDKLSPDPVLLKNLARVFDVGQIEIMMIAGFIDKDVVAPTPNLERVASLDDSQIEIVQLFIDFLLEKNRGVRNEI